MLRGNSIVSIPTDRNYSSYPEVRPGRELPRQAREIPLNPAIRKVHLQGHSPRHH